MPEPTIWRYYFPNEALEGWAEVILTSGGFFAAVSDFGDYAYAWRHHGMKDFRLFFLSTDSDYFARKLSSGKVYDGPKTKQNIRQLILTLRREGTLSQERARTEWDLCSDVDEGEFCYGTWCRATEFDNAWELAAYVTDPQAVRFVQETIEKKLVPKLREQLKEEGLLP